MAVSLQGYKINLGADDYPIKFNTLLDILEPIIVSAEDAANRINEGIRGDAFVYADFTPSQIDGLKVKGDTGEGLLINAVGDLAGKNSHDNEAKNFAYLDTINKNIYFKLSATSGDWSNAIPYGKGDKGDALTWADLTAGNKAEITFKYEDFTQGQLDSFKMTFNDLTQPEKDSLKGEQGLAGEYLPGDIVEKITTVVDSSWGMLPLDGNRYSAIDFSVMYADTGTDVLQKWTGATGKFVYHGEGPIDIVLNNIDYKLDFTDVVRGLAYTSSTANISNAWAGGGTTIALNASGEFSRSENGGVTWEQVTTPNLAMASITPYAVLLAYLGENKWIATQKDQLEASLSNDDGKTWTLFTLTHDATALCSNEKGVVVVGGLNGNASISTDFGQTFAALPANLNSGGTNLRAISIAQLDNEWIVGFTAGYGAYSLDNGVTWNACPRYLGTGNTSEVTVYASKKVGSRCFISNAGGSNYGRTTSAGQSWSGITISGAATAPVCDEKGNWVSLYANNTSGTKSLDNGATWASISANEYPPYHGLRDGYLAHDVTTNKWFIGGDSGYLSVSNGIGVIPTWEKVV